MRKLFILLLFFFLGFLFLFSPNKSVQAAATCGVAPLTGSFCTTSSACNNIGGLVLSGVTCTSGVCCQENTCETSAACSTKGYKCGSFVNNCNKTITCPNTCTSSQTCTNNKCVAPTTYTCEQTPGQTCIPKNLGTCTDNGYVTATGTCELSAGAIQYCCKQAPPPPPTSGGGYDCTVSGCQIHTGAGAGQYTTRAECEDVTNPDSCRYTAGETSCPVCTSPYYYDSYTKKCAFFRDSTGTTYSTPTYENCTTEQTCVKGCGCNCKLPGGFTTGNLPCDSTKNLCKTAFGNISLDPASLVKDIFGIVLSIAGGIAVILIIISGYKIISSQGNPERIKDAQEQLTAAIVGLLFVIFAFSILRFIGVDVLKVF